MTEQTRHGRRTRRTFGLVVLVAVLVIVALNVRSPPTSSAPADETPPDAARDRVHDLSEVPSSGAALGESPSETVIHVHVIDRATGDPLPGAFVDLREPGGGATSNAIEPAPADAEGVATVRPVAGARAALVVASAHGHAEGHVFRAPSQLEVTIALGKAGRVTGDVVDDRGVAVAGATVMLSRWTRNAWAVASPRTCITDASGRFVLDDVGGFDRGTLRADGGDAGTAERALLAFPTDAVHLTLRRRARLIVRLRDDRTDELLDAGRVVLQSTGTEVDAEGGLVSNLLAGDVRNGAVVFEGLPIGVQRVLATSPGCLPRWRWLDFAREGADVDVWLTRSDPVEGRVVDSVTSAGLAASAIVLPDGAERSGDALGLWFTYGDLVQTALDGHLVLPRAADGVRAWVAVRAEGHATGLFPLPDDAGRPFEFRLAPLDLRDLRIRVVDESGAAIAAASVSAFRAQRVLTADDGRADVRGADAQGVLAVSHPDFLSRVVHLTEVDAPGELVVALERAVVVEGEVVARERGAPLPSQVVRIVPVGDVSVTPFEADLYVTTGPDGRFRARLPGGTAFDAALDGFTSSWQGTAHFDTTGRSSLTVRIDAEERDVGRIVGTVHALGGSLPGLVFVTVTPTEGGRTRSVDIGGAPDFVVPALTPGAWTVVATAAGARSEEVTVSVGGGGDTTVRLELDLTALESATQCLVVVDVDATACAGWVTVDGVGSGRLRARDGRLGASVPAPRSVSVVVTDAASGKCGVWRGTSRDGRLVVTPRFASSGVLSVSGTAPEDEVEVRDGTGALVLRRRARDLDRDASGEVVLRVPRGTYAVTLVRGGRVIDSYELTTSP